MYRGEDTMHHHRTVAALLLTSAFAVFGGCAGAPEPAELILLNGKIVTLDPDTPEVSALAARGGRIVAVGTDTDVERYRGDATRVIDLGGSLAVPGFIEGHGHFSGIGASLLNLDLRGARSWEEVVEIVAESARMREPGDWIVGWGWHQEKWDAAPSPQVEGYPTHGLLSRAVPDHPVLLKHAAGSHAGMVNLKAMALAGVDRATPDPPGGKILRDAAGEPTGVLRENAYELALEAFEQAQSERTVEDYEADRRLELELAAQECLSKGVTSFHDAGTDYAMIERMRALAEAGRLGVRLWVMLGEDNAILAETIEDYRMIGAADDHLTVRAIKRSIDGALGSHSAWLLEPYQDLPDTTGLNSTPLEEMEETARIAAEHGFQLCVHAIGDRGNRETLDLYERVLADLPRPRESRWRIEHAQHLDPSDVSRFAELGVIAAMQGIHCTSDGPWVPLRLGDARAESGAYLWRELIDSGAVVINGTDAPVEDVDPIANYFASVTRQIPSGEAFYPDQRMTRIEALESYTRNAAFAAFEEDLKGTLTPGKLADVVVLSRDILTVPEEQILQTEVLYTVVGGEVLYARDGG
jgi:predicted amidohydrolase YtcJ